MQLRQTIPLPMNLRTPLTFLLSPAAGERKCRSRTDRMGCNLLSPWGRGRVRGVFGSRAPCIRNRSYGVLTFILSPKGEEANRRPKTSHHLVNATVRAGTTKFPLPSRPEG